MPVAYDTKKGITRRNESGVPKSSEGVICHAGKIQITINSPDRLAPVNCSLLILVDGNLLRARRTSHIERKNREMEYILEDGSKIVGRYPWTYP